MVLRAALSFAVGVTLTGVPVVLGQADTDVPSPDVLVSRAWAEAGGLEAFNDLGILLVDVTSEETTQQGTASTGTTKTYFAAPGPVPGRIEMDKPPVLAGDDGSGGWAVVGGKPDARQSTRAMVRRLLTTNLFTIMLPFSLNWDGVMLKGVEPAVLKGTPVWRLSIEVAPSFFHSPQIARYWRVDFDRKTYAVLRADCPATDLGKGITADGMRVSWSDHREVMGVRLPGVERTIGLSETGAENTHTRKETLKYELLDRATQARLFRDPVPPQAKPTPPPIQAPKFIEKKKTT